MFCLSKFKNIIKCASHPTSTAIIKNRNININRNILFYTTTTTTTKTTATNDDINDINEKDNYDSIQNILYKEKQVKRIIDLLLSSKYYKNNLNKNQKYKEMNLEDKISSGVGIDTSNQETINQIKDFYATRKSIDELTSLSKEFNDYMEIVEMSKIESDSEMLKESFNLIDTLYNNCIELEVNALMNGKEDHKGCFIEIQAGAGGNDSMDWTKILFQMYCKWGERKGYTVEIIDTTPGEFGYRRATIKFDGIPNAFGWMRTEMGIHKLIRISPFDSSGKRHTSFASVVVYPIADNSIHIDMSPKDLHFETTKSSGAGGQHVNTTESAVRIVHIPTGISVFSCGERSQHNNKTTGLALLKSKLYSHELKKRMDAEKSFRDELGKNGWASDSIVRIYTMHPQERVKDQRTGTEVLQISNILDGEEELDLMIKKALSD